MSTLVEEFADVVPNDVPDVHALDEERLQILWILFVAREYLGLQWMRPAELATVLRDVYHIVMPWQRVRSELEYEKQEGNVARRKQKGKYVYQLMESGAEQIRKSNSALVFIQPSEALSKLREAQTVFGELEGDLRICDPYVDSNSIDLLTACSRASSISVLTVNVRSVAALKRDIAHSPLNTAFL